MSKNTYTAITIGPIYETISLTSSPAGLWAASFIFSYISRRLCELIIDKDNKLVESEEDLISPYFSSSNSAPKDGIGRYHDRIVFKPATPETVLTDGLPKLFDAICEEMSTLIFDKEKAEDGKLWLRRYIQFHAINYESNKNPILDGSKYLDALELEQSFPADGRNPLADLLDSSDSDRNIKIRNTIRNRCSDGKWPFPTFQNKEGRERLPDMKDITGRRRETAEIAKRKKEAVDGEQLKNKAVGTEKRRKVNSYYAIVQTDGDNFGKYIQSCEVPREFSKKCLEYCTRSAELIKNYGGVPIYAGGDDLLFIAPLTGTIQGKNGNLIELLVELRNQFLNMFGGNNDGPTLSLGVAIRYYKYPLYEAFDEAYEMLRSAKVTRNTAAISLQKHSGQSQKCVICSFTDNPITNKLIELIRTNSDSDDVLKSIRTKINEFETLFSFALSINDEQALKNVFNGVFDDNEHKIKQQQIDDVRELLMLISGYYSENKLEVLDQILRITKFWGERGDEENDETTD